MTCFEILEEFVGFHASIVEPCLFIYEGPNGLMMWLIIHVDDVVVTSNYYHTQ